MVVVTFKLLSKPETRVEISQSLQGIADKMKKIEGCVDTRIYQDTDDENIFFLVEEWQQQRHLDDHMKTNLFAALLGIKVLLVKKTEIMFMNED